MNARANRVFVALPTWTRTVPIILHETSHSLVEQVYGNNYLDTLDGHGAEFARIFIQLLHRYANCSQASLLQTAKEFNVAVAPGDILKYE